MEAAGGAGARLALCARRAAALGRGQRERRRRGRRRRRHRQRKERCARLLLQLPQLDTMRCCDAAPLLQCDSRQRTIASPSLRHDPQAPAARAPRRAAAAAAAARPTASLRASCTPGTRALSGCWQSSVLSWAQRCVGPCPLAALLAALRRHRSALHALHQPPAAAYGVMLPMVVSNALTLQRSHVRGCSASCGAATSYGSLSRAAQRTGTASQCAGALACQRVQVQHVRQLAER